MMLSMQEFAVDRLNYNWDRLNHNWDTSVIFFHEFTVCNLIVCPGISGHIYKSAYGGHLASEYRNNNEILIFHRQFYSQ